MHPPAVGAHCRLTVLAPRARVDVALPTDVPVAELVPLVLELVGEPRPERRLAPWRLSGVAGGPLPAGATLGELGVLDGELLRIGPDGPTPPPPVVDDPVDALAATAPSVRRSDRRFEAGVALVVAVAAAVLVAGVQGVGGVALGALGAVVAIGCAARLTSSVGVTSPNGDAPAESAVGREDVGSGGGQARDPDDAGLRRLAAGTAAVAAVPLAAAAGWAALPAPTAASHLLLATAAAGIAAAAAQVALRVIAPALVGIVVAAVPVGLATVAVLRFGVTPTAAAAVAGAGALVVGPLLPRAALRLAGMPRPVVPGDGGELVDADAGPDRMAPDELTERAHLARGHLAGLIGGCAGVAAVAAPVAAAAGGWAGPVFAAVTATVLGLRARGFADRAPARIQLAAAVVAGVGLAVVLQSGPAPRLAVAAGLFAVAIGAGTAVLRSRPVGSPVARRAVDLMEGGLVIVSVPLALAAADLFRWAHGL